MSTYLAQIEAYAAWWRDSPGQMRARQAARRIAPAREASMWYRDHGLDPYTGVPEHAPIITRAMLQSYAGAFIGDMASIADGGYLGSTSGTTGEPIEVMMCAWALAHYYMHLEWGLELYGSAGVEPGWRVAHVSLGTRAAPGEEAAPLWGGRVARLDAATPAELVASIKAHDPHILSCTPSELSRFVGLLEEPGDLRAIVTTSEHVSGALRQRIKSMGHLENVLFMDSYGLSEVGPVAWRCPGEASDLWHVPEGSGWVERLGGQLVVTTWRNRAMPLTRYATGDAIERVVDAHDCQACGHRGQSFWGLVGRAGTRLRDGRGEMVSPVPWIRVLNMARFGVRRHRIEQVIDGELRITCQMPAEQISALRGALAEVSASMRVRVSRRGEGSW